MSSMPNDLLDRVVIDPDIMVGKPIVRGTRIPVELLVRMLSQGIPEAEILREYPRFSRKTSVRRWHMPPTSWRGKRSTRFPR